MATLTIGGCPILLCVCVCVSCLLGVDVGLCDNPFATAPAPRGGHLGHHAGHCLGLALTDVFLSFMAALLYVLAISCLVVPMCVPDACSRKFVASFPSCMFLLANSEKTRHLLIKHTAVLKPANRAMLLGVG